MPEGDSDKASLDDIASAPESLPAVLPESPRAELVELKPRFDQLADENFALKADKAELKQRLSTKAAIDGLLAPYSNKVFVFLCSYGVAAFILLLLNGFHLHGFSLDTTVMSFVVGSTAVSAIGLVGLVIRGIFGVVEK